MNLLLLLACLSPLPVEELTDLDGDGFYAEEGPDQDCDDGNADIYPGAEEICDYVDNNCDGAVDELGLTLWYPDVDGDEYGVESGGRDDCDPGAGWSPTPGDCQDSDPLINPDADEVCDGVDNDCDGSIDVDALDALEWFEDQDGDGYGDPDSLSLACEAPSETSVSEAGDCDDSSATSFPGAEEFCDGQDNDCDGEVDIGASDATAYYSDADMDGWGTGEPWMLCAQAEGTVLDTGDCDDASPETYPGVAFEEGTKDCMRDVDGDGYGDLTPPDGVTPGTDCNDAESAINPAASEIEIDGVDGNCDGLELCYQDSDGDGYGTTTLVDSVDMSCGGSGVSTLATDCDDGAATTYPGATELSADGVDNDCDGLEQCYVDSDGDSYGGTTTVASTDLDCEDASEADNADDCDDSDADINPDAAEVTADGVDGDCDGAELCYLDSDGDSYGATTTVSSSDLVCTGSGEADNDEDCDDSSASVNPGATETTADGVDADCDGLEKCFVDSDGDSYGSTSTTTSSDLSCSSSGASDNSEDCDDSDADFNPGASDTPADGVDQDCDGVDTCYVDNDGDGYGSSSTAPGVDLLCSGSYESTNDEDCDDTDASVSPAGTETVADGVDGDCDGEESCYVDSDGDSYGSTSTTDSDDLDCLDSGESANASDCDDDDASAYPGATEVVGDEIDSDCDTLELCYVDSDGDTYGTTSTVSSADLDCTGSGEAKVDTDCDDSVATAYPGATEICDDGVDNDCDGQTLSCGPYGEFGESEADYTLTGANNNYGVGTALATGDFDGDGTPDLWIGARYADHNKTNAGAAYLLLGPISTDRSVQGSDDAALKGNTSSGNFSRRLRVGDLNNDGNDDLVVHGYNASVDKDRSNAGLVFVYYGPITSDINKADDKNKADAWARGEDAGDYFGYGMAIGDIDNDNVEDLLVGAPYHYENSSYEGASYIFLGGVSGDDLSPDYTWEGGASNGYTGTAMISTDLDGDGVDDWVVGGERASSWDGVAYVVYGGVSADGDWSTDADVTLSGSGSEGAGRSFASGDFDGDGSTDLVVGAPYGSTYRGAVYVLTGTLSTGTISSLATSRFSGANTYDYASWSLDAGCDVNNDSLDDLLIGSPQDGDGGYGYLVLGGWSTGTLSLSSDYDAEVSGGGDDEVGLEMLCVPDMDGNGADEFAVSAPWDGSDKGKVLLFMGGAD